MIKKKEVDQAIDYLENGVQYGVNEQIWMKSNQIIYEIKIVLAECYKVKNHQQKYE